MKKVLLVATVQSHIAQFHKPLITILKNHGYEVHIAARDNLAEKNGLQLPLVDKVFNINFSRSPLAASNINAYRKLKSIIMTEKYDIVHCNTPVGGVVARLATRKLRKQGCKVIYTAHGFHFYKGASLKNWLFYYPIEKVFARFTDTLITINEEDYSLAKRKFKTIVNRIHGVGVDEKRFFDVSDDDRKIIKQNLGFTDKQRLILCVGELLPNKNQTMVINAVARLVKDFPDVVLLLAGNGSNKENLENLVKENNVQNSVVFLGYVTNLEEYQKICDICVSCSKREGLPLNIIEAMLSATPIVATKNRGHCELIEDGLNGYLVDVDDIDEMCDKISLLLQDQVVSDSFSNAAKIKAEKYTFDSVSKELEEIYNLL